MNITEFLEARIAEDGAVAQAASPAPWKWEGDADEDEAFLYSANEESVLHAGGMHTQGFLYVSEADKTHIARHDPARALAECAAKREIIGQYASEDLHTAAEANESCDDCRVIYIIAAVYAGHPDYLDEWKL